MLTSDLLAFVRASLPRAAVARPGNRRREGRACARAAPAGYEVTAIDPAAEPDSGVEPMPLLEARGSFQRRGRRGLAPPHRPAAGILRPTRDADPPGGQLVIDELDIDRYDERATGWWLAQRQTLGSGAFRYGPRAADRGPTRTHPSARNGVRCTGPVLRARRAGTRTVSAPLGAAREPSRAELELIAAGICPRPVRGW